MAQATMQDNVSDSGSIPGFPEPSPQEAMFFFNMIKNMNNQPDIDWDGVATDAGFKNAAVAKKRFYQIKQKLGLDSRSSTAVVKTPRKPRGPKATAATAGGEGTGKDNKPTKVTKRRKTNAGDVVGAVSKAPATRRRRVANTSSESGSEEQGSSYGSDGGVPSCPTVGFLKTEDNGDDDDSGGI